MPIDMHRGPKLATEKVGRGKQVLLFLMLVVLSACGADEPQEKERLPVSEDSIRIPPKPRPSSQEYKQAQDLMFARFERADLETVRLLPGEFVELPAAVVQDLERRDCTIPQPWTATGPANVVKGQFTVPGQIDFAVLCSRERVSTILVFREGSIEVSEFDSAPDRNYLQVVGDGQVGYSRALGVASPDHIRGHNHGVSPLTDPQGPLDHDGIENHFLEKASAIWYWRAGEWLQLSGAD